jgi:hypothetical protein
VSDPETLYLEADDEVTSVVRRIRSADMPRVVVVTPGRSRATSSVVALRLLGRAAADAGRTLAIVGDPLTRSLAAEAGIDAYPTLDDARAGQPPDAAPATRAPRHATITVARGAATDDAAPTMAATLAAEEGTRQRPVARSSRGARPARRQMARAHATRRRAAPLVLLGAFGLALLTAGIVAAAVLPAATVTVQPRISQIGPLRYALEVADAERRSGTETATAEVVATGSYETLEPAAGTVVLFNWTFVPVEVPAGTFVAAGEQAFATQADVTVPRGRLTGQGTIAAGEVEVGVVAAAPGPAGNVAAAAIDTVVNGSVDARLRGFPENPERRVVNPAATAGGVDERGMEITQSDVDAAVTSIQEQLEAAVADAIGTAAEDEIAVSLPASEPRLPSVDGLAGTRDTERVEISGERDWAVIVAERADVIDAAADRFLDDPAASVDGAELLTSSVQVSLGDAALEGERLVVDATVTARATSVVDRDLVLERVRGRAPDEAAAALADIGTASVRLWPGWVTTVPDLEWRTEIVIDDAASAAEGGDR